MTQENFGWLATNVLAGFHRERPSWWYDLSVREGHQPRVWDAEVPLDEVKKLLCGFTPVISPLLDEKQAIDIIKRGGDVLANLDEARVLSHKHIRALEDDGNLGVVTSGTPLHTFADWLVGSVEECVGDEVRVSSAGLLKQRTQAWVQIERPQSAIGPDGIKFSNFVTLSGALDNSLSNQINQNDTMVCCDNTLNVSRGQRVAFRKSSKSDERLGDYRSVLTAIMQGETNFKVALETMLATKVTPQKFTKVLDALWPETEADAPRKRTNSRRIKQDIRTLYRNDPRASGWKGTALGALQAINTYQTHESRLVNRTGIEMTDTDLRAMKRFELLAEGKTLSDDKRILSLLGV